MNCYIECPKNILEELDKNKKDKIPNFLNVDFQNENKYLETIKEVKNFLFHFLIMPYLDLHFKKIFEKLTETYVDKKLIKPKKIKKVQQNFHDETGILILPEEDLDDGEERYAELTTEQKKENEKIKKDNDFNHEQRELIRQEIAMYILNFYLTLFIEDEIKLDEKFMGLYDQNKDICLLKNNSENGQSCYFNYFKKSVKESNKKYKFVNESTIQEFINKLSAEEENPVNFTFEARNFIKKLKKMIF